MKKMLLVLLSFLLFVFLYGAHPTQNVYAQVCESDACTWVYQPYCEWKDIIDPIYGTVIGQQWVCTDQWVCQINSESGNCQCCYEGGCYLNCPGGGGGGGGEPTAPPPSPTPPTPVNLAAVAKLVNPSDMSCAAIQASTTGVGGTVFGFTASSQAPVPAPQTQSGVTPVTWNNRTPGSYTLTASPPDPNYMTGNPCLYRNGTLVGYAWFANANGGETVRWEIGYTYGTPWAQTGGGDAYASATLRSYIPMVTPRVFGLDGAAGYPGVMIYGNSYDFDASSFSLGSSLVSSQNWLVDAARTSVDYYDYFYQQYRSPTATDNALFFNLAAVDKPASREAPYYIAGNMGTNGDWSVGDGESIVFLVEGDLTINGRIDITGSGFIAFIVHGNITIDSSVGTAVSSTDSVVDGIYIATTEAGSGTIDTGVSTAASTARFTGEGMFVADSFILRRDLEPYGGNTEYAAELFVYSPQLLITMPAAMQNMTVVWREVAP